jgi:hypothetical protein
MSGIDHSNNLVSSSNQLSKEKETISKSKSVIDSNNKIQSDNVRSSQIKWDQKSQEIWNLMKQREQKEKIGDEYNGYIIIDKVLTEIK